jgi:hypothetical protein
VILAMRCSYTASIMLKYDPYIPELFRVFIMKGYWILPKFFLCQNDLLYCKKNCMKTSYTACKSVGKLISISNYNNDDIHWDGSHHFFYKYIIPYLFVWWLYKQATNTGHFCLKVPLLVPWHWPMCFFIGWC